MTSRRFALLLALFYVPLVLQGYYNVLMPSYYGRAYPDNTSFFQPWEREGDFTPLYLHGMLLRRGGNPYTDKDLYELKAPAAVQDLSDWIKRISIPLDYFPLAVPLAAALSLFPYHAAFRFYLLLVFLSGIGGLCVQAWSCVARPARAAFLTTAVPMFLLCWPVAFMVDRANWEGFMMALIWIYLLAYKKKSPWAWVFLGAAVAIKPQAALLGFLPFSDRDWPQVAKTAALAAVLAVAPLLFLPGSLPSSVAGLLSSVRWFYESHLWRETTVRFNHTLFGFMKGLMFQVHGPVPNDGLMMVSSFLALAVAVRVLWEMWRVGKSMPFERRALALVVLMLVLPHMSFDYTLVDLLPVFFLILGNWLQAGAAGGRDFVLLVLTGLILAPKQVGVGTSLFPYGPAYLINAPLLLALLCAALSPEGREPRRNGPTVVGGGKNVKFFPATKIVGNPWEDTRAGERPAGRR